jgi:hypothetical protein
MGIVVYVYNKSNVTQEVEPSSWQSETLNSKFRYIIFGDYMKTFHTFNYNDGVTSKQGKRYIMKLKKFKKVLGNTKCTNCTKLWLHYCR